MSWIIGAVWMFFAAVVGAVVLHHRNGEVPLPRHLVRGMIEIGLGLLFLSASSFLVGWSVSSSLAPIAPTAAPIARTAVNTIQPVQPAPATIVKPPVMPSSAPVVGAKPPPSQPSSPPPPAPQSARHLYVSFDDMKQRLGRTLYDFGVPSEATDPKSMFHKKTYGKTWSWNQPDYTLSGMFGNDGLCYSVSYRRTMGFTEDQIAMIVRTEIGRESIETIPGKTNEILTQSGIRAQWSPDHRTVSIEAPEVAKLRAAALADLEAERTKRLEIK